MALLENLEPKKYLNILRRLQLYRMARHILRESVTICIILLK